MQPSGGCQLTLTITQHHQIFPRSNGGAFGKLPFPCSTHIVRQTVIAQVNGYVGAVVKLHPVAGGNIVIHLHGIVGGHDLTDVYAGFIHLAHVVVHLGSAGLRVGETGRCQLINLEITVTVPTVAAILGQVINGDPIHQATTAVGQYHRVVFGTDAEVGVGHAGAFLHLILAGAEHHVVTAGSDGRPFGEAPLQGLVFLVAQGVVFQADGLIGGVVQLNPVAELAVFIRQPAFGIRHDFIDNDRTVRDRGGGQVSLIASLGVGVSGAVQQGGSPGAVLLQCPAFVTAHNGEGNGVNLISTGVEKVHGFAHAGKLKLGVEGLACFADVGIGAEHHHTAVCRQGNIREQETNGVSPVA